ncbi:MAG TPA: penicillin acylase family protein [Candidatus Acidoferrales bacterium]|nr:penicillin acylase family protein [Candidatus Acidoferrales bacterium]
MARRRNSLLALLIFSLVVLLLPVAWFVWRAWRAVPSYDGDFHVAGLSQPVRVVRDERAVPHIYAHNLDDLFFAQGYVHAQERLWQMDLLRRTARGQLAEVFGPAALPVDKENRLLGLGSVADRAAEALDPETRQQLEAYARGVNAFVESQSGPLLISGLPIEFVLLRYRPEPWQPADSLAVGLNMFKLLTTVWPRELMRAQVSERVGPERAADLYVSRSGFDHPIAEPVTGPRPRRRERVFVAYHCRHSLATPLFAKMQTPAASNNWVVAGTRSAAGAPLLADDMHLPHGVPSIWFINHLKAPEAEVDVIGFSLPGLPWVIVGHNGRVAWGFTNLMADTQDLFIERFDPEDPSRYMTPTGWQTVQRRMEHISVRGTKDVDLEVLETRHGPIVHDDGDFKLALQWTARDTHQFAFPFLVLNQAQDWEEFNQALAGYGGPPQNVVYADAEGNIGYHAAGRVPLRRNGHGLMPVEGESTRFDWIDYVAFEHLPQAFNPPTAVLATANNRTVPENYPYYITDDWIAPARVARIYQLLEEDKLFTPDDFLRIQGDVVSLPDRFLAEQLLAAGATVSAHPPERAQALAVLKGWDGSMDAGQAAAVLTTAVAERLLEELLRPYLDDEWNSYQWFMARVFLENVLRERPARWLPEKYHSYDELLLAVLDHALQKLHPQEGTFNVQQLRWGERMRVRFAHPFGDRLPVLRRWFSVGGQPQSGGRYSVKQTGTTFGPSERMVVDFADLDQTLMNITLGQSGHVASPHYQDQYRAWLEVRSFPAPFTDAGVERAARHTQHLLPR